MLSDNAGGGLPKTFVFEKTALGMSVDQWLILENPGNCALRIIESELSINSGDVEEFSIVGVSSSWPRDNGGDLILAPGVRDSIQVRFMPRHTGSRRATLRLSTNDSTVITRGLTERGVFYMDLYGEGKDGLYASGVAFGMTELNTTSSGQMVKVRNAADVPFIVQTATIVGTDAGDFAEDGGSPWPGRPFAVMPGQTMDLSVVFTPSGAVSGPRVATLELVSDRDDTLRAALTGEAGQKSVTGPAGISFGALTVGGETRQTVTITNVGTMASRMSGIVISGANAGEYSASPLTRDVLGVGESEQVEVTWRPVGVGASSATLTIGAEGGDVVIGLSGNGVKTRYVGDEDPTGTIGAGGGGSLVSPGAQDPLSVSGVESVTRVMGVALWQSVPNPARDRAEIRYAMERGGEVTIELFDGSGRQVGMLEQGVRDAGEHRVMVDLSQLAAGAYRYTLRVGGVILNRSLTVVR